MNRSALLRTALVLLVVIALQIGLMTRLRLGDVHPEIIWLVPAAAGLIAGPGVGCMTGFFAGLWLDCLLPTPFGLSALVGTAIGYLAGMLEQRGVVVGAGQLPWIGPALGAAAGMAGVALYGLVGWLVGQDGFAAVDYLLLTPLELVVAASLMMPTTWAMRWALGGDDAPRPSRRRRAAW